MKHLLVLSILSVLCLAWACPASIIGNFEGDTDGWIMENATSSIAAFGATNGVNSLELVVPADWKSAMKKPIDSLDTELAQATAITADITMRNDNNQIPSWWMQFTLIINSDVTGWKDLGTVEPGVPWSPQTFSVSWDITPDVNAAFANGSDWAELMFITNTGSGSTIWIDNIQIVPEPATLSIFALGGLALIRRRRAD